MSDHISDNSAAAIDTSSHGEELDGLILGLIGDSQPITPDERRFRERFPICCKMLLTPIDRDQSPLTDETSFIVGKDLSTSGICFSHEFLLSHRRVTISLTHPEVGQFNVEADIIWSRRTPIGLYESGCRLIRKAAGYNVRRKT
jgi:hypothetical protein